MTKSNLHVGLPPLPQANSTSPSPGSFVPISAEDLAASTARHMLPINASKPATEDAVVRAISNVMAEVGSVRKEGRNTFHNYTYATAADILHKLQPLMAREGLVILQNEIDRDFMQDGAVLAVTYEFTIHHVSGASMPTLTRTGMAPAKNTKGGFDDKALNKCHTSAHKYFLITLFEIPTGDYDDPDADEDKPAGKITEVQASELAALIEDHVHSLKGVSLEAYHERYLAYMSRLFKMDIKSLADIPADKFDIAKAEAVKKKAS